MNTQTQTPNNQTPSEPQPAPNEVPSVISQSPTPVYTAPTGPRKSRTKLLIILLILLLLIAGGYAYYHSTKKDATVPVNKISTRPKLTLPNEPKQLNEQYSSQYLSAGYVQFKSSNLKPISDFTSKADPVLAKSVDSSDRKVVFMSDLSAVAQKSKRLVMYDVASGATYLIDQDNSVGNYYNAHIMSNHYVVYAVLSQSDPVTQTTAIKSFDLNSGNSKTIASGKSSEIPISMCCAVSSDGLRMAIPGTNTLMIYQAGEDKPTSFNISLKVFPDTKGNDSNDYAASQRNGGYPGLYWLDDDHIMFAKANQYSWTVDGTGSHIAANNNGLAIYDIANGTTTDIPRTADSSIKWFTVDGSSIVYTINNQNLNGLTVMKLDNYTKPDSQPLEVAKNNDYQARVFYDQSSKILYIQAVGAGLNVDTSVVQQIDTATGKSTISKIGTFQYPELDGVLGPDQLIVNNSYSVNNDYNLYNPKTQAVQHLFSFTQ